MPLARAKKLKIVEKLGGIAENVSAVVFADFFGMKTKDMNELRKSAKSMNGNVQIVKKTLAERGLKDVIPNEVLRRPGGVATIWFKGEDITACFKAVWRFSKKNEALKILGGYTRDIGALSERQVLTIAQLPPRDVLIAQFVGVIASPLHGIVTVLNGNLQKLALILSAIQRSKQQV